MGLTPLSEVPFNGEASLDALRSRITPVDDFYVRSNFPEPVLDPGAWRLRVGGAVDAPREWSLDQLRDLGASLDRTVTLECAGNGRSFIEPPVSGTPWTLGATGTAVFTGVPLADVLRHAAPQADAVEWCFTGADVGDAGRWGRVPFQRSLPVEAIAPAPDGPLLAWSMNGRPLTVRHGAPVRLVVPGWYAVASVKWLVGIDALTAPFQGRFQTDRYLYVRDGRVEAPVERMKVRALILEVARRAADRVEVSGIAWSGAAEVTAVEVSTDGGARWSPAELAPAGEAFTRRAWRWSGPAPAAGGAVWARATDATGARQPTETWTNDLGYGNNEVHRVPVPPAGDPAGGQPSS